MMDAGKTELDDYIPVICIGAGFSGVCLGVQLQRQLGFTAFHLYDELKEFGGTWCANTYPGCACDVPVALYSFSFAQNFDCTATYPPQQELLAYIAHVADSNGLRSRTTFRTRCDGAEWDAISNRWLVTLRNVDTGSTFRRQCSILVSAVGGLSVPKPLSATADFAAFKGSVFHSAQWDHSVDLRDKDVVVIGNGCSATQFVPVIAPQTRSLTQIMRSPHWVMPPGPSHYTPTQRWIYKNVPFALQLLRLKMFLLFEFSFLAFFMTSLGEKLRDKMVGLSRTHILGSAPKEYHDILIPDYKMGCKRRVFDSGYMQSLHNPNLHLVSSPVRRVLARAVETDAGSHAADVVILATGFQTNHDFVPLEIVGRDGVSLRAHWAALGGPGAYESIACSGFPNFLMLLGANWATGHTSTLLAIENSTNLAIKLLRPVLRGQAATVEVKEREELAYVQQMQRDLRGTVWAACHSWYKSEDGWNGTLYPWSQLTFWWRCQFPRWRAWTYSR